MTFQSHPHPAPKTVPYVEDSEVNAAIMKTLFDFHPQWRLVIAADGRQALELAGRLRPSLLLLDIGLPDCRGDELLPRLQSLLGEHPVPAIAVTAEPGFSVCGTAFDEVWSKPLDLQHVLARLGHWLQQPPPVAPPVPRLGCPARAPQPQADGLMGRLQRGRPSTIVQ